MMVSTIAEEYIWVSILSFQIQCKLSCLRYESSDNVVLLMDDIHLAT